MTYLIKCPACQQDGLDPRYGLIACTNCKKEFHIVGFCPKCHRELKKFQCCSIDFFWETCNELISKKKIDFKITPAEEGINTH